MAQSGAESSRDPPEWSLLWGLFTSTEPGRQEALCEELLALPPTAASRYLLQLVYLAVCRPAGPLEAAVVQLCGRSFNTAVQVSWLLLALLQDQPWNRHIRLFRDACERAALSGSWLSEPQPAGEQQQQQQQQQVAPHQQQAQQQQPNGAPWSSCGSLSAAGHDSNASPPSSPSLASPSAGSSSPTCAAAVAGSGPSVHRFRDSLDLEIMRHTSRDLMAGPAAAAAAASGGSASSRASPELQLQQQEQQQQQQAGALPLVVVADPHSIDVHPPCSGSSASSGKQLPRSAAAGAAAGAGCWAAAGSAAAACGCFEDYLAARRAELAAQLGPGEGVSSLMEASHAFARDSGQQGAGWLVVHEEDHEADLTASALLALPAPSPRAAAGRAAYLATLDFVEALCETSSSLTRFAHDQRRKVLRQCLGRINDEVEAAAAQGVAVRYPIGGCRASVLRLLTNEAAILNSRDKAPFLLMVEVQQDQADQAGSTQPPTAHQAAATVAAGAGDGGAGAAQLAASQPAGSSHQRRHEQQPLRLQQPAAAPRGRSPLSRSSSPAPGAAVNAAAAPVDGVSSSSSSSSRSSGHGGKQLSSLSSGSGSGSSSSGRAGCSSGSSIAACSAEASSSSSSSARALPSPALAASPLELQMQQAAAMLRGEPGCQLLRVQLRVQPQVGACAQQRQQKQRRRQQQAGGKANGHASAAAHSSDKDAEAAGPWVFGELPASSSSGSMAAAQQQQQQQQQQVALVITVVEPPVVRQLGVSAPPHRRGRRLPSLEAIDLIAGKLGKAALPPPTEIGPQLDALSSSGTSSDGEDGGAGRMGSSAGGDGVQEQADDAAAAGEDWQRVRRSLDSGSALQQQQHQQQQLSQPLPKQPQLQRQQRRGLWQMLSSPFGSSRQQQGSQQAQPLPGGQQLPGSQQSSGLAAPLQQERSKQAALVYGERLADRAALVAGSSPYSARPGWGLAGLIVKSGDDCRQELLALQLIRELGEIWAAAGLPLWVLPFEVLVTSADTALIQLIPDATSVHTVKARSSAMAAAAAAAAAAGGASGPAAPVAAAAAAAASSAGVSLSDHFFALWGRGSAACVAAQRRFVESLAGYSLVTYLLQVKDRHNGNIMLDSSGRLVHIDFGFLLSNAPGGGWVTFEAAPMKLTREALEVMDSDSDGQPSELFDYFKVLCIQGFLAARKERHRITGLVRIMAACTHPAAPPHAAGPSAAPAPSAAASPSAAGASAGAGGSAWPCFVAGPERVVAGLEGRFMPGLSEAGCVDHVLRLIASSLDAWSTRQYDAYQRVLNGIM